MLSFFFLKVDVTWDETDHERVTSLSRTFKKDELLDMDFQAYLASSSEEEQEGMCNMYGVFTEATSRSIQDIQYSLHLTV